MEILFEDIYKESLKEGKGYDYFISSEKEMPEELKNILKEFEQKLESAGYIITAAGSDSHYGVPFEACIKNWTPEHIKCRFHIESASGKGRL